MSFVPTKDHSTKKQQSEQEQAASRDWHQGQRTMEKDPLATASHSYWERRISQSHHQSEVRHLSGDFNTPTQAEVDHHNETRKLRGFRGTIKGWVRKSSPPAVV